MLVPVSWLREYVEIQLPPHELAERLTLAGLDVESIKLIGLPGAELPWQPEKILVGELLAVHPHPDADRLVLAEVDYGGPEPEVVVSGPPSLLPLRGQSGLQRKVVFALEGARLWDPYAAEPKIKTLKATKIRGVASRAMVCSEKELGLSDEHEDIIYLPDDAPVGTPLVDYLGDAVFDIDIKGPFAHLYSIVGVARETAALLGTALRRDVLEVLDRHPAELTPTTDFIELEIADPDLCSRYTAAFIRGVTVGPSPFWMQTRLRRAGMRPINNIVDVTNYVMLELGQPLHAFDYHVLRPRPGEERPAIVVRRARPGERMATLDRVQRTFDGEMLLITDGGGPVAVAGVMGGLDSEVETKTEDILLESANFDFLNVRRTSRLLGLASEASLRFGRQVDPELTVTAAARAAHLMAELGGGTVVPVIGDVYPGRHAPTAIKFDPAEATRILGIEVPVDTITRILASLEFQVAEDNQRPGILQVTPPSHRPDVTRPVDLVEEVARIWGYDRFPTTLLRDELPPQRANLRLLGAERVRDILAGCGLDEVITYSLVDLEDEGNLLQTEANAGEYLRVINPLSAERSYLRRTLLPTLLHTARENLRFLERVNIFEIGAVYLPRKGELLPDEPRRLGIVMTGPREERSWLPGQDREAVGFYTLKGVTEALLKGLGLEGVFEPGAHAAFHPGRCAQLQVGGEVVGVMGEIHPAVREAFDLPAQPLCALELDLDRLLACWGAPRTLEPLSTHPPVYEDLALVVGQETPALQVRDLIAQAGQPLLRSVTLFDVYCGEQVAAGKKSLAYRLTYQADDRTLTDREVGRLREKIIRRLERELGAVLRG
ncbi:MAG: phenylalanine--tRNA ligase subunit beta [Anaerolineae bacterium]|nr:phenylalanine--tRNA ligase subunit beta [Anaerolineae bacterium]